jgi:hypothetical protein
MCFWSVVATAWNETVDRFPTAELGGQNDRPKFIDNQFKKKFML